jgi:hypothetical protein
MEDSQMLVEPVEADNPNEESRTDSEILFGTSSYKRTLPPSNPIEEQKGEPVEMNRAETVLLQPAK